MSIFESLCCIRYDTNTVHSLNFMLKVISTTVSNYICKYITKTFFFLISNFLRKKGRIFMLRDINIIKNIEAYTVFKTKLSFKYIHNYIVLCIFTCKHQFCDVHKNCKHQ